MEKGSVPGPERAHPRPEGAHYRIERAHYPVSNLVGHDLGFLGQNLGLPKLVGQKLGKPRVAQSLGQNWGRPGWANPS